MRIATIKHEVFQRIKVTDGQAEVELNLVKGCHGLFLLSWSRHYLCNAQNYSGIVQQTVTPCSSLWPTLGALANVSRSLEFSLLKKSKSFKSCNAFQFKTFVLWHACNDGILGDKFSKTPFLKCGCGYIPKTTRNLSLKQRWSKGVSEIYQSFS